MKTIFEGIRILDLGRFVAVPYAATLLADFGAEVIRVERSEGEEDRITGLPSESGDTFTFLNQVRNKKAITLNFMTNKKALGLLMELVKQADVFLHNFAPGIVEQIGIDYETISSLNPRIIYGENSAYGSKGPYADRIGFDQVAQAISGAMAMTGMADSPPLRAQVPYVDYATAILGAFGLASALYQREKTGKGTKVETSLLNTAVAGNATCLSEYDGTGKVRTRNGNTSWYTAPSDAYQTKDGKWIVAAMINTGLFKRFCRLIGREDIMDREELQTSYGRFLHNDELSPLLRDWIGERTAEEVEREFKKARLAFCRVYEVPEVLEDPQVISEQAMVDVDCRESGQLKLLGTPVRIGGEVPKITLPPPRVGEHNKEIYCGLMSYSEDDLARLKSEGVI